MANYLQYAYESLCDYQGFYLKMLMAQMSVTYKIPYEKIKGLSFVQLSCTSYIKYDNSLQLSLFISDYICFVVCNCFYVFVKRIYLEAGELAFDFLVI
jgi:hypothetical protein